MKPKIVKAEVAQAPAIETPSNVVTMEAPAETIVVVAAPTLGEVITEGLSGLNKLAGDEIREHLIGLLAQVRGFKPEKLVFSQDKKERKLQMIAFKHADRAFRSQLGKVFRAMQDAGLGEYSDRHTATVSATGSVTVRHAEALRIKPPSTKIAGFRV